MRKALGRLLPGHEANARLLGEPLGRVLPLQQQDHEVIGHGQLPIDLILRERVIELRLNPDDEVRPGEEERDVDLLVAVLSPDIREPTEATVPLIASVAPDGVTSTDWPAFRLPRSALPTVPSSFQVAVEITLNWAVLVVLVVELLPLPEELLPPEPRDFDDDDDPLPVTLSPSSALTAATVPAMGERSTALLRSCLALVRAALAELTWAFAEAIAALLPSLSTTSS